MKFLLHHISLKLHEDMSLMICFGKSLSKIYCSRCPEAERNIISICQYKPQVSFFLKLVKGIFANFYWIVGFPDGSDDTESAVQETRVRSVGWDDPLEKGMVIHSSILAWRIPWKRSLVGCRPWGHKELNMTEQLTLLNCGHL